MSLSRTISLPLRHHATSESSSSLAPLPLMRYGSFGNRRLLLRPPNSNGTSIALKSVQSVPRMPLEMLEHILEHYADSVLSPTYISGGSQKTCYKMFFAPSTLVSKDFRQLALRAFFRALIFRTTDDCSRVLRFLDLLNARYLANGWIGGYRWVRLLSSPSFLITPNVKELRHLLYLQELHIDFSHSGLFLQRACLKQLFGSLASYRSALSLTSLKLTELPRIDDHMISLVAKGLPNLVDVRFTSTDSLDMECCPNCYEDSLTRISHSPVSDLYSDVIVLADAFGRALAPLKNLTHVFFGIFLSPSNMLDSHINHGWKELEMKPTTVETIYNCVRCARYENPTKKRELLASLLIAHHVESLRTIGWASPFGNPCAALNDARVAEDHYSESGNVVDVLRGRGDHADDVTAYSDFALAPGPNLKGGKEERLPLHSPCACSGHGLKTTLLVHRASGKITVSRMPGI